MSRKLYLTSALVLLILVGARCGRADTTSQTVEQGCPGEAPACETPQLPECNNSEWSCVAPVEDAAAPVPDSVPTPAPTPQPTSPTPAAPVVTVTVIMNNGGFNPAELTIARGTKVFFENQGDRSMWPASNPHPTHTALPGFNAKEGIPPTAAWSYTFTQAGTWGYHDHLNYFLTGTIIVK